MSYDVLVLKLRKRGEQTRHTTSDLLKQAADAIDDLERQNHFLRLNVHAANDEAIQRAAMSEPYYATGQPVPYKDPYWGRDGE